MFLSNWGSKEAMASEAASGNTLVPDRLDVLRFDSGEVCEVFVSESGVGSSMMTPR